MAFLVGRFPPALSDIECLTVELVGQYLGYASQKQLYEHMRDRWSAWFPALRDRVAFTRHAPTYGRSKPGCIITSLSDWAVIGSRSNHRYAPGAHLPCRAPVSTADFPHRVRRPFPAPTLGYCAAKDERYFGFKGGTHPTMA